MPGKVVISAAKSQQAHRSASRRSVALAFFAISVCRVIRPGGPKRLSAFLMRRRGAKMQGVSPAVPVHEAMREAVVKILVIGGCGFIGSHIVDQLQERGHSVKVLDRHPEQYRASRHGVEYVFGDFTESAQILEALTGVDAVMHLASTTVPGTADLDPSADVRNNLLGTLSLLESMTRVGVSRILFLSSGGTVYGPPDIVPIPESHPLRPINSYGIVKTAIEHYLQTFEVTRGLLPISIRASNPYGPRQGHTGVQGVISTFLKRALAGEPIEIWGDGSVVRDYLHVGDLAEVCALAIASEKTGPYNAGFGEGVALTRIVDILQEVIGRDIAVVFKPSRKIDVSKSVLDVTRARADFCWTCRIGLREGIENTYRWLQQQVAQHG